MRTGRPKKSTDVECTCIVCGAKFVLPSWKVKAGKGKFCSDVCYKKPGEHRQRPKQKIIPIAKACECCGKEFLVGGLGNRRKSTQFCSRGCKSKFLHQIGVLKGGSNVGRILDHAKGHFEYLRAKCSKEYLHECVCGRLWTCKLDVKETDAHISAALTTGDIQWAAGIYDGEGSCQLLKNKNGTVKTQHVSVGQKERWMCDRMRDLFGGYVSDEGVYACDHLVGKVNYKGRHRGYSWHIHGPRARGFIMTIYKFLSPRRQKRIREVLNPTDEKIS